jgi:hypothetical protein
MAAIIFKYGDHTNAMLTLVESTTILGIAPLPLRGGQGRQPVFT